jgi:glycosyltransferase involved in cell wall biosynthesis
MRIAIDALGIHNFGGGRTASLTLLEGLLYYDKNNQYIIYLSRPEQRLNIFKKNSRQIICPFKNRFLMRLWAQAVLPSHSKYFDLIHYTKNLGIFGINKPSIVTIFDLTTLIHPELFPKFDVWYWKTLEKKTLLSASRVIAISEATGNDLETYYSLPTDKIKIIYPSIDPRFHPSSTAEIESVRHKYNLPESFIVHVGRIDRKKNLSLLVEAFAMVKRLSGADFKDKLVLVGEIYYKSQDMDLLPTIKRLGLSDDVLFTNRVPDEDLPPIITGAKVAVSASIHEGFGLAAVEALACGTPLIAYKAGALQEAVGDAALLLDRLDCDSLTTALMKINQNTELGIKLKEKGLIRAARYHCRFTANETLKLYEEIYHEYYGKN